jgi:hypothetical protein
MTFCRFCSRFYVSFSDVRHQKTFFISKIYNFSFLTGKRKNCLLQTVLYSKMGFFNDPIFSSKMILNLNNFLSGSKTRRDGQSFCKPFAVFS